VILPINLKKGYTKPKGRNQMERDFDAYAKASLDFNYYAKEIYPIVHKMRTGKNTKATLPKDFLRLSETTL
jgi:hypothetical protein